MVGFSFSFFLKKDNKTLKETVHIKHLVVFFSMKFKLLFSLIIVFLTFANVNADQGDSDISFYTGTFDVIDKEGDDQTTLFGIEHKNPNLFRDTFLGKFKPVTGAFMTGNSSVYLYTGIPRSSQLCLIGIKVPVVCHLLSCNLEVVLVQSYYQCKCD